MNDLFSKIVELYVSNNKGKFKNKKYIGAIMIVLWHETDIIFGSNYGR